MILKPINFSYSSRHIFNVPTEKDKSRVIASTFIQIPSPLLLNIITERHLSLLGHILRRNWYLSRYLLVPMMDSRKSEEQ